MVGFLCSHPFRDAVRYDLRRFGVSDWLAAKKSDHGMFFYTKECAFVMPQSKPIMVGIFLHTKEEDTLLRLTFAIFSI